MCVCSTPISDCPTARSAANRWSQSAQAITERLLKLKPGLKMTILAPVVQGRKGEHREILENLRKDGFIRARIDGETVMLDEEELPVLQKTIRHTIEAVIDRLVTGKIDRSRLTDSVETALRRADGVVNIRLDGDDPDFVEEKFCEKLACPDCGVSYGELAPRNFSFNSPYGACPECNGLGITQYMDPAKVIPDPSKSIANGAIPNWRRGPRHLIIYYNLLLRKVAEHLGDPAVLTTPFNKLAPEVQTFILEGSGDEKLSFDFRMHGKKFHWEKPFEGILENLKRRMNETESDSVRERLAACLSPKECPACRGARLNPTTLGVTVGGKNISEFNALSVEDALRFLNGLELDKEASVIASDVLKEIISRLTFLKDVGLSYLTLNRVSSTLSGGEAQRIRLATQLGCGLVGVLYILDEPSIGLHQRD
ncbi:MAG: excinuclease ABC subunit UvrA, partial [Lentisphaeria bacterium]|nr:excinuclease ABC subunit UvrA [Lentisphaeria bacterium]